MHDKETPYPQSQPFFLKPPGWQHQSRSLGHQAVEFIIATCELSLEPMSPGEALPCSDPCLRPWKEGIHTQVLTVGGVGRPGLSLSRVCCHSEYLLNEPPRSSSCAGIHERAGAHPQPVLLTEGQLSVPSSGPSSRSTLYPRQALQALDHTSNAPALCSAEPPQWDHPFPWSRVVRLAVFQTSAGVWIYRACRILLCKKKFTTSYGGSQDPHTRAAKGQRAHRH